MVMGSYRSKYTMKSERIPHTQTDSLTNVIAGLYYIIILIISSDPPSFVIMYIVGINLQWTCTGHTAYDILTVRFYMTVNLGIPGLEISNPAQDYGIEKMTPGLNALVVVNTVCCT